MKKLALSLCGVLLMLSATSANAQVKRAMWVWHTTNILQNVAGARQALFDFCAQPPGSTDARTLAESSRPITVLYFYCHSYVNGDSTKKAQLRSFLRDAHAKGIEVEFLDGAPDWATTGKSYALNYLNHALNFNAGGSSEDEKFDGIQYDVEPYLLSNWFTNDIWNSFIDLVSTAQHRVDSVGGLRFGVAIPRWYDSNPGRTYLVELQSKVDYVAVMNYTDKAANMIADATNEIKIADSLGKKVVLGSETLAIDPISVTFAQEGWGNMEARLFDVDRKYRENPSFDAIAIHEYDPYKILTKYGTGLVDATAPSTISSDYMWTSGNGAVRLNLIDICGTGVSSSGTTTGSKITLDGTSMTGSWTASDGYLKFGFATSAILKGGTVKAIFSPTDIAGNVRRDTVTFVVAAQPLLASPVNGATNQPLSVPLKWKKSAYASLYRLQVSTSATFATVIADTILTDTTFSIAGLANKKTYYWRVFAANAASATKPSNTFAFTTKRYGNFVEQSEETAAIESAAGIEASLSVYPNPASNLTSIEITVPELGVAEITLHNEHGALITSISSGNLQAGRTTMPVDLSDLPQGTYFVRMIIGEKVYAKRISVIR